MRRDPGLAPVTLRGRFVELVPLEESHAADLSAASRGSDAFRYMPVTLETDDAMLAFIRRARGLNDAGTSLAFAVRHLRCSRLVGSTGFWNADATHRRVEIGFTWLDADHRRTEVNTECKLLLLGHAFDTLGCSRVEFKTDARNTPSRAALLRIGAREEGILRRHMILWDGSFRDSVYFGVLEDEWAAVRSGLEAGLESPPTPNCPAGAPGRPR